MFKKIILSLLLIICAASCKKNNSIDNPVDKKKLDNLKAIYKIIGNKIIDTDHEFSDSIEDKIEYLKMKEEMSKKPKIKTYGESNNYACDAVSFDFFKDKYYAASIDFSEMNYIIDEEDGYKVPSYSSSNLVIQDFDELEIQKKNNKQSIIGTWTTLKDEKGTFEFNLYDSEPNTIYFKITDGRDKKFSSTVTLPSEKYKKIESMLNNF